MRWLFLFAAILLETGATLSLRKAATGDRIWYLPVVIGYVGAFGALTVALAAGLGLGVAYGIWAACGVALTAAASRLVFKESLTPLMSLGIMVIAAGVLLVQLGATH